MRCYLLRKGHIAAVEVLNVASDEAAIAQARAVFEARKTDYEGFEVWERARFVYRYPELPPRYVSTRTDVRPPYSLYLLGDDGVIRGSFEFAAESDEAAHELALGAFDACSDRAVRFELWHGSRQINPTQPAPTTTHDQVRTNHQAHVVAFEETARDSQWAVVKSERLLARLKGLKATAVSPTTQKRAVKDNP